MLDTRAPVTYQCLEEERRREEETESQVQRLMCEARLWRVANSAQWVAWGIVQAKIDGMDEALEKQKAKVSSVEEISTASVPLEDSISRAEADASNTYPHAHAEALPSNSNSTSITMSNTPNPSPASLLEDSKREEEASEANEEEFDYLGYAQERAMLFWGDVLGLGLVKKEDLPENLLHKIKIVEY